MRLRKLLIAGSAMAAAAAFALVPVAQASTPGGSPGSVRVGANTTGTFPIAGTLKSGTSITLRVYGTPTKLTCMTGDLIGTAHAGSPAPNPAFNFTTLTVVCESWIPTHTATFSVPANGCANWRWAAGALVHDGLTDTGPKGAKFQEVLGSFNLPPGCPMTMVTGPCTATFGGSTTSNFDEDKDPSSTVIRQNLNLKSNGPVLLTGSALCLGAVTVGDVLTMNSVNFNIASANGAIDIRDN